MKRKDFLVLGAPQIVRSDIKDLGKVYRSGWWVAGPKVERLTKEFKEYIGSRYAIPVNSGTAALHLSLDVLGIEPGDEVITTPFTFPATAHVIIHLGAKPVFVDIRKDTFNIDSEKIEEAITPRTKAIIPIHVFGQPCEMDEVTKIAKRYKLFVVEDACHTVEAWYKDKKIGTISDMSCFSFDVTKNVAGGMGGMITTNNKEWAEKTKVRSHFGMVQAKFSEPYDVVYPGYKYDMTEFCASIALHQLRRVEENLKLREKYWQMYNGAFKDLSEITTPFEKKGIRHARHLYPILLNLERLKIGRKEFMEALAKENIGSRIRFSPIHLHKWYQEAYGFKRGDFPITEYVSERVVCLPLSPRLKEEDVNDVIKAVRKVITYYRL